MNEGVTSCVDEFLVLASSKEELLIRTIKVLLELKCNNLYCKLSKCAFEVKQVDFLGFLLSEVSRLVRVVLPQSPIGSFPNLYNNFNNF